MDALQPWTFVTILLLVFALVLLVAGAFTAYFGSGKSRKIGAGLLVGGLVIGLLWGYLVSSYGPLNSNANLGDIVVQSIVVLLAAFVGAGAAIGLFLLAIMKS
ncbi:MAG TPA: hypothetical protein VEM95_05420 [Thermoplasmata archaeon]|nr:hypothetical protein [Thermoplasmata archaeon]